MEHINQLCWVHLDQEVFGAPVKHIFLHSLLTKMVRRNQNYPGFLDNLGEGLSTESDLIKTQNKVLEQMQ